ncbi:thiol-activated cytolysin family protein [Myroides odoratimimus]|uniref:thiol-activated cytolysin family protein n=1 Tax=Myroides odoratimimus TaxID=76832 RepID=UPI0013B3A1F8|nr:thiol-activated cytolysin family protein [Myroides odoratimimus]
MNRVIFLIVILIGLQSCEKEEANVPQGEVEKLEQFKNYIKIQTGYDLEADNMNEISSFNGASNSTLSVGQMSLSEEDEAFFTEKRIVKSREPLIVNGKNQIYPGAVFEGDILMNQTMRPIVVKDPLPITLTTDLVHTSSKDVRKTYPRATLQNFKQYVAEVTKDGAFKTIGKDAFSLKQFYRYDELKEAFGSNVNTIALFGKKSERNTNDINRVSTNTALMVKFYVSSFTVMRNIEPLSKNQIKGAAGEPLAVSSVTYGRMGVATLETNADSVKAKSAMQKTMNRLVYNVAETLTKEEQQIVNSAEFSVFISGATSGVVETYKGIDEFIEYINTAKFTEGNYGEPIACTFTNANTLKMVEVEFDISKLNRPLYATLRREEKSSSNDGQSYNYSYDVFLDFYSNRAKTIKAYPKSNITFSIDWEEYETINSSDGNDSNKNKGTIYKGNSEGKIPVNTIYIGREYESNQVNGALPNGGLDSDYSIRYSTKKFILKENKRMYLVI